MWKFADDTMVSEVVPPSKHSTLQQAADFIHDWSRENHLQLNPIKSEEIRTCFKRTPPCFSQVAIEVVEFEIVSSAKVLGVVTSSDLKWSAHIDSITTKADKRLWALSIRPKIPEIPGWGANGTDIFRNFIPKFWVYLARLA